MEKACPYFKDNKCISKYCSEIKMRMSEVVICETEAHLDCPIYIETIRREKK